MNSKSYLQRKFFETIGHNMVFEFPSLINIKSILHVVQPVSIKFWLVIGSLLLTAVQLFVSPISQTFSLFFLATTLFFFGLPHGALDHQVEARYSKKAKLSFAHFSKSYVLKILITCIIWLISPSVGLVSFLLFSGYHFGETDLRSPEFGLNPNAGIITFYGLGILGCLLLPRITEVWLIVEWISPVFAANKDFTSAISANNLALWSCFFLLVSLISGYLFSKSNAKLSVKVRLFIPALLLLILYPLPSLTAFTFYFGLWHSLHALMHIRKHLGCSLPGLVRIALPCSIISTVGLVVFIVFIIMKDWSPVLMTMVFISALTTPHVGVMMRMYDKGQLSN